VNHNEIQNQPGLSLDKELSEKLKEGMPINDGGSSSAKYWKASVPIS
jgi:hypothetical protein